MSINNNLNLIIPETKESLPDEQRRRFLLTATGLLAGIGAACALTPFVTSWMPSATALAAGGPIEVDLSHLEPGQQLIVAWQGKPIWVIRRTAATLKQLEAHETQLRDPDSHVAQQPIYAQNKFRSIKPEYLVLIGLCTHLGCSPTYKADGFYCPCHGSTFDLAGRVFKQVPAPINLEVPPHYFIDEHRLVIGENG